MRFSSVQCPVCLSDTSEAFYKDIPAPEDRTVLITVAKCLGCGLLYQNPRADVAKFVKEKEESIELQDDIKPTYIARLREIEKLVPRGKILDIGCGYGDFLFAAKSRGWEAFGVEPSRQRAALAKKRGLRVACGYLRQARFPKQTFSAITMLDLLEHLPDPHAELRECSRIMKGDGVLAIRTPLVDSLYAKIKGRGWYFGLEHLAYYSLATLKKLLGSEGFEIRRIYYGDEWSAMDSLSEIKGQAGKKAAAFLSGTLRKIHIGPLHLASATVYCKKKRQ